jgi:hypothetical protein
MRFTPETDERSGLRRERPRDGATPDGRDDAMRVQA